MRSVTFAAASALVLGSAGAHAQPSTTPAAPAPAPAADGAPTQPRDIVILTPGTRSRTTDIVLVSLAGAAVVAGGLGVYWNLDAKSAADKLSASQPTGLPWTSADQHESERAHDSSIKAGVCYGLGGAFLIGAVVGLIVTTPAPEKSVIHPRIVRALPAVAPTPGGLVAGGVWRF